MFSNVHRIGFSQVSLEQPPPLLLLGLEPRPHASVLPRQFLGRVGKEGLCRCDTFPIRPGDRCGRLFELPNRFERHRISIAYRPEVRFDLRRSSGPELKATGEIREPSTMYHFGVKVDRNGGRLPIAEPELDCTTILLDRNGRHQCSPNLQCFLLVGLVSLMGWEPARFGHQPRGGYSNRAQTDPHPRIERTHERLETIEKIVQRVTDGK